MVVSVLNINKKSDLIIQSKISNNCLNLGKYRVKRIESKDEYKTIYKCFDIENFKDSIINSECFVKKVNDKEVDKYLFYNEGFYYVGYIDSDCIAFYELLNSYYDNYFPLFTEQRLISCTSISDIYYKNIYTYEDLKMDYGDYFEINDKDSLLNYINSLDKNYAYYDENIDQIFIKRNSDLNDEFNVHIKFIDEGITIYGKR